MVQLLNQFIQKWMPVLTPLSLVIGVLLEKIGTHFLILVPILFAMMTFISSLNLKLQDIIHLHDFSNYQQYLLLDLENQQRFLLQK